MSALQQQAEPQRSLYRRHRPRTFAEVVGQETVVRTLRNAVERDRVHHAYLFVGARGTGKTSMAKILAACLNCEQGPTTEPCGRCESCASIASASSLDVIEMDAASNNSVEDIRELRESVTYAPVSGRRKVYILDEAHMLSTAAWNAFLKTLEEPPPNTVFVLATTEAQKVPATVVDRCHRFDFQRPGVDQIAAVIRRTAQAESIEIPPEAIAALARAAEGSFRDALGTLEQLVTYAGSKLELADALSVLGATDAALLERTVDAVATGDPADALRAVQECVRAGRDPGSFASDLEVRARELLVAQILGGVPPELSLTEEADAALRAQAERTGNAVLVRLLELLGQAMEAIRAGADPRTRLELALVKASTPELDGATQALIARIERLEREQSAHPPQGAASAPPKAPRAARGPATPEPAPDPKASEPDVPAGSGAIGEGTIAEGAVDQPAGVSERRDGAPQGGHAPRAQGGGSPNGLAAPGPSVARAQKTGQAEELESVRSAWPGVVDLVRAQNALLGALIEDAEPVASAAQEVTVAFAASAPFLKKKAEDPANRAVVTEALTQITGKRWQLTYELGDLPTSTAAAGARARSEEEWVSRVMEEFDAQELAAASEQPAPLASSAGPGGDEPPPREEGR